ncbi:hypothetical protein [Flavobacterium beibuense]|uniref:hypothetical protein n=1 Tax=Flavobacterium beibuense TaxID=657326 RepID=UPI003A8E97BC
MKNFLKIFCLAAIVASCDDVEPTVFHGEDPSNVTLLSFSDDVYSLPVERDANGSVTVYFNSSTVATSDRTFNVEVVPGSADSQTYSLPSTVTIPAGQYQGIIEIQGTDNNLVDEEVKTFTIKISDSDFNNESLGFTEALVRVFEVCPLIADFTGTYQLESISSMFSDLSLFDPTEVTLSVGSNAYERVFSAKPYPGYNVPEFDFNLIFQCDYVNLSGSIDTGLGCNEGNSLKWAGSDNPAVYNTEDDSVINVNITENTSNDCNQTPTESSFRLTKTN